MCLQMKKTCATEVLKICCKHILYKFNFIIIHHSLFLDKDRYGYQMLEKMGWADGKGLGKNKSGNTAHVKIKKRKQNLGMCLQCMIPSCIYEICCWYRKNW